MKVDNTEGCRECKWDREREWGRIYVENVENLKKVKNNQRNVENFLPM